MRLLRRTIYLHLTRTMRFPQISEGFAAMLSILRFLRSWQRRNAAWCELSRLGDRELADIGISRSDVPRVASETR